MPNPSSGVRGSLDPRWTVTLPRTGALTLALALLGAAAPAPALAQAPACTPTHTIAQLQGNGTSSPFNFFQATTTGVVTARWTASEPKGFFVQMAAGDGDAATSDAIFVTTGLSDPPLEAMPGHEVCVEGLVFEAAATGDATGRTLTTLAANRVDLVGTGRALPAPVTLTAALTTTGADFERLEHLEGMRVRVTSLTVVAPTAGVLDEVTHTVASTGVFFGVVTGVSRPFREAGVDVRDELPWDAPAGVARFDGNAERLRVDSKALGLGGLDVATGATVSNVVGPLYYADRAYTVLPETTPGVTPAAATAASGAVPEQRTTEATVATLNAYRLFDTVDSPDHFDDVLTPDALARRLAKLSLQIRTVLRSPDLIGVQDVENLALLQALAARVNADAVAAGQPDPGYEAYLVEGTDPLGLDVGLLAKSSRVTVTSVVQEGRDATFVDPATLSSELLNERPPLVVRATVSLSSGTLPVNVVVTHLRSLVGIADPWDGYRVRAKRAEQAQFLAGLMQDRQAAVASEVLVVLGDFNAHAFNDGFVDVVGTVKGTPAPASAVVTASTDVVNPDLTDALAGLTAGSRYTGTDAGDATELQHVLVNDAAATLQSRAAIAHANADFPEALLNDASRAERAAASDSPVVYFELQGAEPAPNPTPTPVPAGPVDITAKVKVKVWRSFYFWRHRGYTYALVDVTNLTSKALSGPFHLAIAGLPAGAQVVNARVTIDGKPAVPVHFWHQLRPFRTMRAWVVLKGVPTSVTPTVKVYAGKVAVN